MLLLMFVAENMLLLLVISLTAHGEINERSFSNPYPRDREMKIVIPKSYACKHVLNRKLPL